MLLGNIWGERNLGMLQVNAVGWDAYFSDYMAIVQLYLLWQSKCCSDAYVRKIVIVYVVHVCVLLSIHRKKKSALWLKITFKLRVYWCRISVGSIDSCPWCLLKKRMSRFTGIMIGPNDNNRGAIDCTVDLHAMVVWCEN